MTLELDKEALTGIRGATCRYGGDPQQGLRVEIAPGVVLALSPGQIRAIFRDLSAHNLLLEECAGYRSPGARDVAVRWARKVRKKVPRPPISRFLSPRFEEWIRDRGAAVLGERLSNEAAAVIQAVFGAEGLLPIEGDHAGDFPVAGIQAAATALQGRRLVYEEGRRFLTVEVLDVLIEQDRTHDPYLRFTFRTVDLPGFYPGFPRIFTAGGQIDQMTMYQGHLSAYMAIWSLITGPRSVGRVIELAARELPRARFLDACRNLVYGTGSHSWRY